MLLTNTPVLATPVFDRPFKLAVDPSETGAGAILLQDDADGVEQAIFFFSKTIQSPDDLTIEKKALALVLALNHFEVYVGSAVPLVFINQVRNSNQRIMHWALVLLSFIA